VITLRTATRRLSFAGAAVAACALALLILASARAGRAATNPYARVPAAGDSVRFDASHAGEKQAWAYPNLNYLEAFLRSVIDASYSSMAYEEYQKKMSLVLSKSLVVDNGTVGVVQHVQTFVYRDHEDVEVEVQVQSRSLGHSVVWTTPAELVNSSGRTYLH
jgi:hypothetical protein